MIVRYLLPGTIWYLFMWLLFLTPVDEPILRVFGGLPARSLIHGLLFVGFSHLWLSGLNRQLRYAVLKKKAFVIVPAVAIISIVAAESIYWIQHANSELLLWNLLFDIVGSVMGILSFRLLYNKCY
ncbi:hypothetical protein OAK35_03450 [Crocinitomicaceae bacterium]|nr:hypothetical protein [Crocinitomicaceae bacterium]MDC0257781.1 hypothetical protein [Crocinitomicaceae bacterium]